MKRVAIIGGSGFIGSHVTKKFLAEGYTVQVSTTDISKPEKYEHLKELPNADFLEIIQLDVLNIDQLKLFVQDCEIVIHGGTPFQLDVENPKSDLFDPTVKGTENFLEIIKKTPCIEKVVFIASVAAYNTNFPLPAGDSSPDDIFDEHVKPFMSEESHPYALAKYIANQTVEAFIRNNQSLMVEITSVSPVAVMGKSLSTRQDSTSTGLQYLFKNNIAPSPFIQMIYDNDVEFAVVDVKDVADSIFQAATKRGLHGNNYLLSSESWKVSDISAMLNKAPTTGAGRIIYKCDAAKEDLDMVFNPAWMPLHEYNEALSIV